MAPVGTPAGELLLEAGWPYGLDIGRGERGSLVKCACKRLKRTWSFVLTARSITARKLTHADEDESEIRQLRGKRACARRTCVAIHSVTRCCSWALTPLDGSPSALQIRWRSLFMRVRERATSEAAIWSMLEEAMAGQAGKCRRANLSRKG